ncbi:MAG: enoyl-CoA hydratase/isomerase family protein [Halioglobus sp.]
MDQRVLTSIDTQGIATVTLNAAQKHNAFDDEVIAALRETFIALARNEKVRVVILAANGKSFSAGADLNWMKRMAQYDLARNEDDARALAEMLQILYSLPMPTIARVQGAAFGGGVGLVACCDIAIATDNAAFCLSEVKLGLIPATISPYVIKAMGERAAKRYFMTAERFDAGKALSLGLVSEIVPAEKLDTSIAALCHTLCGCGPTAVRAAKLLATEVGNKPIDNSLLEDTSKRIAAIRVSAEGQEGLAAFLNKRKPNWIQE